MNVPSINTALSDQSKTAIAGQKLATDFNDFLRLLTTQLQNQDPLSPMDSTEFTNQLVAFTGVEQQINTNQKLDNLVAMGVGNGFTSALSYVGMDINYLSAEMNFDGATPVKINYALEKNAKTAKINIMDEQGKTIYSKDINPSVGNRDFTWDGSLTNGGKAKPGTYQLKISAFDTDDAVVKSTTVVTGRVRGIETQNGLIFALVGDRAVALSTIINATRPQPAAAT